jgi:hypothetical protein
MCCSFPDLLTLSLQFEAVSISCVLFIVTQLWLDSFSISFLTYIPCLEPSASKPCIPTLWTYEPKYVPHPCAAFSADWKIILEYHPWRSSLLIPQSTYSNPFWNKVYSDRPFRCIALALIVRVPLMWTYTSRYPFNRVHLYFVGYLLRFCWPYLRTPGRHCYAEMPRKLRPRFIDLDSALGRRHYTRRPKLFSMHTGMFDLFL